MHVVRTSQQVLIAPVGNLLQKPFAWLSLRACSLNQQTFKVRSIQVSKRRFEQSVTHLFDLFRDGFKKGFVFIRVWVHWKKLRFYLMTKSPNFQVRGIQMSEKQMEKISWNFQVLTHHFDLRQYKLAIQDVSRLMLHGLCLPEAQFTWNSCDHLKPYKSLD